MANNTGKKINPLTSLIVLKCGINMEEYIETVDPHIFTKTT